MALFRNGTLEVRRLIPPDYPLLSKWLSNPTVLEFYEGRDNPHDLAKVEQVFDSKVDGTETGCIATYEGTDIGYIQFYPVPVDEKTSFGLELTHVVFGMDQFIGESAFWNRGIGTHLVQSTAEYLRNELGGDQVIMEIQARNRRAIRCYEKAGFRKIRWLPKHELHEGEWRDCWLMGYPGTENSIDLINLSRAEVGEDVKAMLGAAIFEPSTERIDALLNKVYSAQKANLFGLRHQGTIVAVAGTRRVTNSIAELLHIAVKPSEQNKGFGRELVGLLVRTEGITELFAETDHDSVGFYKQCGFSIESLGEKYPGVERFVCRWRGGTRDNE